MQVNYYWWLLVVIVGHPPGSFSKKLLVTQKVFSRGKGEARRGFAVFFLFFYLYILQKHEKNYRLCSVQMSALQRPSVLPRHTQVWNRNYCYNYTIWNRTSGIISPTGGTSIHITFRYPNKNKKKKRLAYEKKNRTQKEIKVCECTIKKKIKNKKNQK